MNTLLLLAALAALAICAVGVVVLVRRYYQTLEERRREEEERAAVSHTTIIDAETHELNGATVAAMPAPRGPWYRRVAERSGWGGGLLAALAVLLVLIGLLVFSSLGARSPERYLVLVAPFDDGGDGQTGRNVAASLARELEAIGGEVSVGVASRSPADAREALELATAEGGDLLIWGSVEPGAMLDSPSLSPSLIYIPSGPYAPNGWDGYLGRFAMPRSYTLAREPINGRAVLVPLVGALYRYASGAPDSAFDELGQLLENYPSLNPPLPRALRGNVLWARTYFSDAAAEYRLALAEPSDEQALLANNLGAILLDAGDPEALAAFQEAVGLLEGRDLGELRFNLATLALRENRPLDAVVELEQARNLLPPQAPLLLTLAGAYREAGRLDAAALALADAGREAPVAIRNTALAYRSMISQRYDAMQREEQALLDLARQIDAQGELLWELEVAPPQTASAMSDLRRRFDAAADRSAAEVAGWRRRATSDSAVSAGGGLVATGQAERAEANADRQRFYLAVAETELARVQRSRPRSIFGALFGGQGQASHFAALEELQRRYPESARIANALARAHRLNSAFDSADQLYDRAISLAPQAPEGYFGKGAVAHGRGDLQRASELFNQALERNGAFFPARYELAAMAEEQNNWPAAIEQRRALYQQRAGDSSAVALAQALRLSGPAGYVEAEQVLVPISARTISAAIELARLYNDAGRPDAAIGAYQGALRIDPDSSVAAFELGETYQTQGNLAEAERYYSEAVRTDPANVEARLALADLYQGPLEQPERAEREYSAALSQGVDDPEELAKIGAAAMATGNYGQAVNAYSEAARLEPNSALYRHRLGQAYFAAERLQQAAEEEHIVLNLTAGLADPEAVMLRAEALVTLGDVARLSGDLPGATGNYTQALQLSPNLIAAEIGLGLVAVGQGNWGVASGYFQTAANMPGGADDPMAQFWLGEALLRQGSYASATAAYNRALELRRQQFPEAYLGLAQVQYAQSGPREALATVTEALNQRPDYAEALLFQGKMLQELGERDRALAAYNASIRANGRIAESYFRRGMVSLQIAQYDNATSDFRQATSLQPNFPEAFYWLGRSYYAEGRLEPALQAFQQAVALNGNYLEAIFYVGLASEDLGRTAEAVSAYQTVIAIDASGEFAERARASLARLS